VGDFTDREAIEVAHKLGAPVPIADDAEPNVRHALRRRLRR
jgi:hypothetical protein